jgi:hypothetical protein
MKRLLALTAIFALPVGDALAEDINASTRCADYIRIYNEDMSPNSDPVADEHMWLA